MKPIAIGDSEFKVCHNDTELEKVAIHISIKDKTLIEKI